MGRIEDGALVEVVLRLALHLDEEAGAVGIRRFDIHTDAALVGIGIGMLLRSVLDVHDLPLGDELLQEQGEQALAARQLFESAFEPVVEQDVGVHPLGFTGDVPDAGFFEILHRKKV